MNRTSTSPGTDVVGARDVGRSSIAVVAVLCIAVLALISSLVEMTILASGKLLVGGQTVPLDRLPQVISSRLQTGKSGSLADAEIGLRLISAFPSLLNAATVALATILLVTILRRIAEGFPFDRVALVRWKALTLTLIIGSVAQVGAGALAFVYAAHGLGLFSLNENATTESKIALFGADYSGINIWFPDWPLATLVAGLIALALSAAFRSGARLLEAADGLV